MKKGKIIALVVLGILLVGSVFIGTSYSVWNITKNQTETNIVKTDCFNITYTDNEAIYINQAIPISDSEGAELTPYTFTVKNTCNREINYNVNLEYMEESTIDTNFVRVKLDDYAPFNYKEKEGVEPIISGASKAAKIGEGTLKGQESKTFNLRLWIKESATSDDVGNTRFASRISVAATPNRTTKDITLEPNGGVLTTTKISVTPGRALVNLPYPTKEGYAFKGWYNNQNFDTLITGETIMNEGLDTLYAKWVESNHTINLHPGEGSVEPTSINAVLNEALGEIPIPEGFDETKSFLGWYADSSFENHVTSETIITSEITDLYAKIGIPINENGYNYWTDDYSSTQYAFTSAPEMVYQSYTNLVSANESKVFIRTKYENGNPNGHGACLYYNNNVFCLDHNYWASIVGSTEASYENGEIVRNSLQNAMESAYGTSAYCTSYLSNASCYFGSTYCNTYNSGRVSCGSGSRSCHVEDSGYTRCK